MVKIVAQEAFDATVPGPGGDDGGGDGGLPDPGPPAIGSSLKHYEIIRKLGEGGMGAVYLARDTKLGRRIALEVLLDRDEDGSARFLAEARSTARCEHENIVVIHEVDEHDGCPYMALEHLEGRTLRAFLDQQGGPVPPGLAVELTVPIVRALACAHALGVVHRDLKPENVFLTDAGTIKVLDFGIAKQLAATEAVRPDGRSRTLATGTALTQAGALMGTLPYMSPEQWRRQEVDARTDLWAVGIMLFELCAGAHPLAPLTLARLAQIVDPALPMPKAGDARPDLGALGDVIDKCLQKQREARFASAEALLGALEPLLPGHKPMELGEAEGPFAGLAAFQEADAGRFFGRERDVAGALSRLRSQALLAVAGPSGAGKSSFVRAGLIPALKRSGERWEAFVLRPGRRPLGALADVLVQVGEAPEGPPEARDAEDLARILRERPGVAGARLRARCRRDLRYRRGVGSPVERGTRGGDDRRRAGVVRAICSVLVAVALVTAPARRAAADGPVTQAVGQVMGVFFDVIFITVIVTAVAVPVVAVSGTTFTVHDVVAVTSPPPAVKGWSIAETAVATPLALGVNAVTVLFSSGDLDKVNSEGGGAFTVLPAGWMNGLAIHGAWSLAAPQTDPGFLFGASIAAGVDLALTTGAIASATQKHFGGRGFGAVEMIATAPTIVVGTYELASPGRPSKPTFAALTAWSGALFVHGIAAVATGVPAERARIRKLTRDHARLSLTPTMLAGGPVPATAFVLGGVW